MNARELEVSQVSAGRFSMDMGIDAHPQTKGKKALCLLYLHDANGRERWLMDHRYVDLIAVENEVKAKGYMLGWARYCFVAAMHSAVDPGRTITLVLQEAVRDAERHRVRIDWDFLMEYQTALIEYAERLKFVDEPFLRPYARRACEILGVSFNENMTHPTLAEFCAGFALGVIRAEEGV